MRLVWSDNSAPFGPLIGDGRGGGRGGNLDKHYIFAEIAELNSFLIERRNLPALPIDLEKRLGFVHQ